MTRRASAHPPANMWAFPMAVHYTPQALHPIGVCIILQYWHQCWFFCVASGFAIVDPPVKVLALLFLILRNPTLKKNSFCLVQGSNPFSHLCDSSQYCFCCLMEYHSTGGWLPLAGPHVVLLFVNDSSPRNPIVEEPYYSVQIPPAIVWGLLAFHHVDCPLSHIS